MSEQETTTRDALFGDPPCPEGADPALWAVASKCWWELRWQRPASPTRFIYGHLAEQIEAHQRRVTELQGAINAELDRRRKFEAEASQYYAETVLLRNECIRLRRLIETLAAFIEKTYANTDEAIPDEIAHAMEAFFPPESPSVDRFRIELLSAAHTLLCGDPPYGASSSKLAWIIARLLGWEGDGGEDLRGWLQQSLQACSTNHAPAAPARKEIPSE